MICGRCGHKIEETVAVCMRCRIAFPEASLAIKRVKLYQRRTRIIKRIMLFGALGGLGLAAVAIFLLKADMLGAIISAATGAGGGIALAYLPKLTLSLFFKWRLSRVTRDFNKYFDQLVAKYQKRLEAVETDRKAIHELGLVYLVSHDYPRAISLFQKAAELEEDPGRLNNHLGITQFRMNNKEKALEHWNAALGALPDYAPPHFNIGVALAAEGKYREAINEFDMAELGDPSGTQQRAPMQLGRVKYEQGGLEEAIIEFNRMPEDDESIGGDIHNNLGICYYIFGERNQGVSELQTALTLQPGHARAHANLGLIQLMEDDREEAVYNLGYARELEPSYAPIRAYYGLALYKAGYSESGIQQMETALQMPGLDFDTYFNLGRTYIAEGEIERGVDQLRRALSIDPVNVDGLIHLGAAYFTRDRFVDAEQLFRQAMSRQKDNVIVLNNLAMTLLETGRTDEAIPLLDRAIELSPESPDVHFNMGYALHLKEEFSKAAVKYRDATNLRKGLVTAHYNRGVCFLMDRQWNAVIAELRQVLSMDSGVLSAHYPLGCAYQEKRDLASALHHWEIASKADPRDPDLHTNLGLIYYLNNNFDRSIDHFQRAVRLREGREDDFNNLAIAFVRKGNIEAAIRNFEHAMAIAPTNPVTHSNLGLAYFLSNEPERALVEWTRVAALDPHYARRRGDIATATYDDTQMAFMPFNWRAHILRIAPMTTPPRYRLILGYNNDPWWLEPMDQEVVELQKLRKRMEMYKRAMRSPGL